MYLTVLTNPLPYSEGIKEKEVILLAAIFTEQSHTGDIVTQLPSASRIFKEYRIDFCCGGNRPIGEVLEEKNLNAEEILNVLNTMYADTRNVPTTGQDWTKASYSYLVDHIISKHHAYLKNVLPELGGYVTKVYRVHGQRHPELATLYKQYHNLKIELEEHMIHEEDQLFPLVGQYENSQDPVLLAQVLELNEQMEQEHDVAGDHLKEIRRCTGDFTVPEDACTTYRLTYLKLAELEDDLFQHIHLENNILFPRLASERISS